MKAVRKLAASPAAAVGALVLAIVLLGFGTVGGARAALTYYSDNYISTVQLQEIGVSLYENGRAAATGNARQAEQAVAQARAGQNALGGLLQTLTLDGRPQGEDEPFRLGARYDEELKVHNPTDNASDRYNSSARNITQYVRVTIYRYWTDGDGNKLKVLDPKYIQLWLNGSLLPCGEDDPSGAFSAGGWLEDPADRTDERIVLYYTRPVAPGADTAPFASHFSIDPEAGLVVEQTETDGAIATAYLYNGAQFCLKVKVDAVQDHNAADAILSAWGRRVSVGPDGALSLG